MALCPVVRMSPKSWSNFSDGDKRTKLRNYKDPCLIGPQLAYQSHGPAETWEENIVWIVVLDNNMVLLELIKNWYVFATYILKNILEIFIIRTKWLTFFLFAIQLKLNSDWLKIMHRMLYPVPLTFLSFPTRTLQQATISYRYFVF